MSYLTKNETLEILDSFALAIDRLKEVYGTGTETGTASKCLRTNISRILQLTNFIDYYTAIRPLLDYTNDVYTKVLNSYLSEFFRNPLSRIWALQDNDLDSFLTSNDARIHPNIKDVYQDNNRIISPSNVMCPPITNAGTYSITGGSGTFTDGDAVDTSKYGKTLFKVKTTTNIGSSDLTLTITCKKINNTTEDKQVVIPGNTASGVEFNIGNGTTDMYIDITNITHTGGNNGDAVQCFSVWERELSE